VTLGQFDIVLVELVLDRVLIVILDGEASGVVRNERRTEEAAVVEAEIEVIVLVLIDLLRLTLEIRII
jgi:hypothetical protein